MRLQRNMIPKKVEIEEKKAWLVSWSQYYCSTAWKSQHNTMDSTLNKYSKDSSSVDQIINKFEMYRNTHTKITVERNYSNIK